MTLQEAVQKMKEKNAEHPEFPMLFIASWRGCEKQYGILQRGYTAAEKRKIACGILAPIEDDLR